MRNTSIKTLFLALVTLSVVFLAQIPLPLSAQLDKELEQDKMYLDLESDDRMGAFGVAAGLAKKAPGGASSILPLALPPDKPSIVVANIVRIILGFVGIIFIILILYAGITWMTSGGNEDKIQKAKQNLINASIGLTVIFISYAVATSIVMWLVKAV